MIKYFIIFSVLGGVIAKLMPEQKNSILAIVGIAILWGIMSKPIWGLVTLGELLLGYFIVKIFFDKEKS